MTAQPSFKIASFVPIFPCLDLPALLPYYTDKLGFSVEFTWEEPPLYAILDLQGRSLHLSQGDRLSPTMAYVFCENVAALHEAYQAAGANITRPLATQPWNMQEFEVTDPAGNRLVFGESTESEGES